MIQLKHMILGPLGTNCYIVHNQDDAAVIDPGASGGKISRWLIENNLRLQKIMLTHSHFDHIGGVKALKESFPDANIVIGSDEAYKLSEKKTHFPYPVDKEAYVGLYADEKVKQGDIVQAGLLQFSVLETPGHTSGGVCYICGDWIFSGDTLFYREVGRTDLDGGSYEILLESLKKLADLQGDYTVYPGHDRSTSLNDERKLNPYMQEAIRCVQS